MNVNPMIEQLSQRNSQRMNPQIAQIKNLMNTVKAAQNPQYAINQLMTNNPQLQQAMLLVRTLGGDPKTAFYTYAQQMGVDPNEILKELQSL